MQQPSNKALVVGATLTVATTYVATVAGNLTTDALREFSLESASEVLHVLMISLLKPWVVGPVGFLLGLMAGSFIWKRKPHPVTEMPSADSRASADHAWKIKDSMENYSIKIGVSVGSVDRYSSSLPAIEREISEMRHELDSFILTLRKAGFTVADYGTWNIASAKHFKNYLDALIPFILDHYEEAKLRSAELSKLAKS